jgi:GxxExxY protein
MSKLLHKELTDEIIGIFYDVYNELGYGFLERVYQNALYIELIGRGFNVESKPIITVFYKEKVVGAYEPDLMVDGKITLELKSIERIHPENERQLLNYLKSTEIEVGLLLNFGVKPEFVRKVFTNEHKKLRRLLQNPVLTDQNDSDDED